MKAKQGNPNWGKGKSGNPAGRPKHPSFREACEAEHPELIDLWWKKMEAQLRKGDSKILIWFGDQINGKAAQPIVGADGGPVAVQIIQDIPNQ